MARLDRAIHAVAVTFQLHQCKFRNYGMDRPIKWGDDGRRGEPAMKRILACIVLTFSIVGLSSWANADTLASYSIVAYDPVNAKTVLLARAVVDGAETACPNFVVDGTTMAASRRYNPDANRFPVAVCEVVAALDATVSIDGQPVATMSGHDGGSLDVAILGDSGCSPKDQSCEDGWPFPELASAAASQNPDLVIHMGDYDYRGTPSHRADGDPRVYDGCVPGADASYVSLHDLSTWETWRDDLITPAASLMSAAPWVVVRGNHELCSRGGDGWFYLLDPHSDLLDPLHGDHHCTAPIVTTQPYRIAVGELDMVVLDNSDGCDASTWQDEAAFAWQVREFSPLLTQVADLAEDGDDPVWLLTHRPFWTANVLSGGATFDGSDAWQLTLKNALDGELPDNVSLVLSGHVHEAQALSFDSDRPSQIVVGNSGTHLDSNAISLPVAMEVDGQAATGWVSALPSTTAAFGYLSVELDDAATWRGDLSSFDADGSVAPSLLMTCAMPIRDGDVCAPPAP